MTPTTPKNMRQPPRLPISLNLRALVTSLLAVAIAVAASASAEDAATARAAAHRILTAARAAYLAVPALRDEVTITVMPPGAEPDTKTFVYRLGPGHDALFREVLMTATAVGDRLYITRADVADRYLSVPYAGDFAAALATVFGDQAGLPEMPQIAMRTGKDVEAVIDALRFNLLGPLHVAAHRIVSDDEHGTLDEIELAADDGVISIRIDRAQRFLRSAELRIQPAGAPADFAMRVKVRFDPEVLAAADGAVFFEPGERRAVAKLSDLESKRIAHGQALPDLTLATIDGGSVELAALRGSVVVLDFWATWCVPCWQTLPTLDALARWAAGSGKPIRVFAVNTLEYQATPEARLEHVRAFWKTRGLSLTSLFDADDSFFGALGAPGLPSMLIVDPEGRVVKHHVGEMADMETTLRKEVLAILDGPS